MILLLTLVYFVLLLLPIVGESSTRVGGLQEHATPSLLIAGSIKTGTSFLWNMLRSCHIDFVSSDRKGALISSDKEFNVAFRAQRYEDAEAYPCPAQIINSLMRCPINVAKQQSGLNKGADKLGECVQWIQQAKMEAKFSQHTEFVKPYVVAKYTVDASPFLLRDASALMPTLVGLNSQNSQCHESARYRPKAANSIMKSHWSKGDESFQLYSADTYASSERHPFVISMLRDPLARTVSFYNYFTLSRAIRANEKRRRDKFL